MAEQAHCYYCFDVLAASLSRPPRSPLRLSDIELLLRSRRGGQERTDSSNIDPDSIDVSYTSNKGTVCNGDGQVGSTSRPLFVTWNIYKSGTKQLRGCIGTFEDQELEEGLRSYALTSAFDDTRFNPIEMRELSYLECGVSILMDFEPASDPMDWTLGVHGLRISFVYHHRRLGATYLPDVPVEQRWSKEETIISLMRKAGWSGRKHEWHKVELSVIRYKGTKANVDYAEYRQFIDSSQKQKSGE